MSADFDVTGVRHTSIQSYILLAVVWGLTSRKSHIEQKLH
jgi:hypothetical protein